MCNGLLPTVVLPSTGSLVIDPVNVLGMMGASEAQVVPPPEIDELDVVEFDSDYVLEEATPIDLGSTTNLNASRFDAKTIPSKNIAIPNEAAEGGSPAALFGGVREFLHNLRASVTEGLENLEAMLPGLEPALAGVGMGSQNGVTGVQTFFVTNKSDGQIGISYSDEDVQRYTGIVNNIQVESTDDGVMAIESAPDGQSTITHLDEQTINVWIDTLLNIKGGLFDERVAKDSDYRSLAIAILALGHIPISINLPGINLTEVLAKIASDKKRPLVDRLLAFESGQVREILKNAEKELRHTWLIFNQKALAAKYAAPSTAIVPVVSTKPVAETKTLVKADKNQLTLSQKLGRAGPTVENIGSNIGWGSVLCNLGISVFHFYPDTLLPITHWGIGIGVGLWALGQWVLSPLDTGSSLEENNSTKTDPEKIIDLKARIHRYDMEIKTLERKLQRSEDPYDRDVDIPEKIQRKFDKRDALMHQLAELEKREELKKKDI